MKKPKRPAPAFKPQIARFIREYDANGGNGTKAYRASHPENQSQQAAATGAHRLLINPQIAEELARLQEARFLRLQMTGDEALARVAMDARADIRELFDDETGKLLPPHLWPDSIASSVKAVRADGSVTLNDSLAARRMILEQAGKLKNPLGAVGELARLLAGPTSNDLEDD